MKPSKEMQEKARHLVDDICDYLGDDALEEMRSDIAADICTFSTAEVSLAMENIEMAAKTIAWGDSVLLPSGYAVVPETWLREAASRAVQECIEAQCWACEEGLEVVRRSDGLTWRHPHGAPTRKCYAAYIHELLYQKQLANKDEAR